MKKIILAALSVLMILSLVGCGEHIDYTDNPVLGAGAVPGAFNGWDNTTPWTTVDDDKCIYTYEFTASAAEVEWKAITIAGDWNSGAYIEAQIAPDGTPVKMTFDDKTGGGTNACITGLTKGNNYRLTVYAEDGAVYAKVEDLGAGALPVPYIFNGLFIVGDDFGWTTAALDNALMSYTTDLKGNVTYVKQFKAASSDNHAFRLCQSNWQGGFGTGSVAVGGEALTLTACEAPAEAPNVTITGLTVGNPYQMTITTTPDAVVTVSISEICAINVKLNVIGFPAGTDGMTGVVSGTWRGWDGWTSAWQPANPLKVSAMTNAVIQDGVATFTLLDGKIADIGEVVEIKGCGYYGEVEADDIASPEGEIKLNGGDFAATFTVDGAATWVITLDLENGTCEAAKQ